MREPDTTERPATSGRADAPATGVVQRVFDDDAISRLRELDPDGSRGFVARVLGAYEESLVRHRPAMDRAVESGDLKALSAVAHTLKSSSASVGAKALAQACADCERMARAGDAAVLGQPVSDLRARSIEALAAVRSMLAR